MSRQQACLRVCVENRHLLVEEDEDGLAAVHAGILQNVKHLVPRFLHALVVVRVQHENQSVGVGVVVAPKRP